MYNIGVVRFYSESLPKTINLLPPDLLAVHPIALLTVWNSLHPIVGVQFVGCYLICSSASCEPGVVELYNNLNAILGCETIFACLEANHGIRLIC